MFAATAFALVTIIAWAQTSILSSALPAHAKAIQDTELQTNALLLYLRIAGLIWTILEWIAAILLWKGYRMLSALPLHHPQESPMTQWISLLGSHFDADTYLFWSRIEGSLWTVADIVLCFYIIRIANLLRQPLGLRPHILPYVLLALTLPIAVFIPIVPHGHAFFRIELAVTLPHFAILVYILAINLRHGPSMLALITRTCQTPSAPQAKDA